MKPKVLLLAAVAASLLPTIRLAIAEESSSGGTADKIESVDLEKVRPLPGAEGGDAVCLRHQNPNQ
jgi:hypothetical protein